MNTTSTTTIDKIEVFEKGFIQVRERTVFTNENGVVAESYNRFSLFPGEDVSEKAAKVQAVCLATWTPEVIAAYQARRTV